MKDNNIGILIIVLLLVVLFMWISLFYTCIEALEKQSEVITNDNGIEITVKLKKIPKEDMKRLYWSIYYIRKNNERMYIRKL